MSFDAFKLHPSLLRAVRDSGYTQPTPIQGDAIPPALEGRDVLGCAMTGSGKTAAFVLPVLERLLPKPRGTTRALILTPTRELAAQVQGQLETLGKYTGVKSATIFGGVPMPAQKRALESGVDVIVATPGRLLDHFQHKYAKLSGLEMLVFDEADRMLDMGFLPDIRRVLKHIPKPQQTLFFSATMPAPIAKLTDELLHRPVRLNVERQALPATGVTQTLYPVSQDAKQSLLLKLLESDAVDNAIVFTRTKHRANRVAKFLMAQGVDAERIHGDRSQGQRTEALAGFKSGKYRVLVATDIAARGIDIEALEHVINFDVPAVPEDYIHRVGRTARAERTGEALTFVSPDEEAQIRDIEKAIGRKLPRQKLSGFDYNAPPPRQAAVQPIAARGQARGRGPTPARPPHPSEARRPKPQSVNPQSSKPESPKPLPSRQPSQPPARAALKATTTPEGTAPASSRRRRRGRRGGSRNRGASTT